VTRDSLPITDTGTLSNTCSNNRMISAPAQLFQARWYGVSCCRLPKGFGKYREFAIRTSRMMILSNPSPVTPFSSDSRANRLYTWASVDHKTGHDLWLRGPEEVVTQVRILAPEYRPLRLPMASSWQWTHVLRAPGSCRPDVAELLETLRVVLSLRSDRNLIVGVALDWYKKPVEGVPPNSWPNTEVGELIHRGKYWYQTDAQKQAEVGRDVVSRLCRAIQRHPVLRQVEVILDVPGHDSRKRVSFGSRMADAIARNLGRDRIRVQTRDEFRPAAKSLDAAGRAAVLRDQFRVDQSLVDRVVLVVDDVLRSGDSMNEVVGVAYRAGAKRVDGICAARTLKR